MNWLSGSASGVTAEALPPMAVRLREARALVAGLMASRPLVGGGLG